MKQINCEVRKQKFQNGELVGDSILSSSIVATYTPELVQDVKEVWGMDFEEIAKKVIEHRTSFIKDGEHLELKTLFTKSIEEDKTK